MYQSASRVLVVCAVVLLLALPPGLAAQQCGNMTVPPPDQSGIVWVLFDTGDLFHNFIFSYFRGQEERHYYRSDPFGIFADARCFDGSAEFVAKADCVRDGTGTMEEYRTSIPGLGTTTQISLTPIDQDDAGTIVRMNVKFAPMTQAGRLRVNFYELGAPPPSMDSQGTQTADGTYDVRYNRPGYIVATAFSCGGAGQAVAKLGVNGVTCGSGNNCSTTCCVGDPVRLDNGNLRIVEDDPIPGDGVVPFRRNYDSRNVRFGRFGEGYTSTFDAVLHRAADGSAVSMMDESGVGYLFFNVNGSYVQEVPRPAGRPTTVSYDSNSGLWTHRDGEAKIARVFNSAGRIVRYIDLLSARATELTYDGAGKPIGVSDSYGAWSWTVATDNLGRIASISVDGQPNSTWRYEYGNQLVRVQSPLDCGGRTPSTRTRYRSRCAMHSVI